MPSDLKYEYCVTQIIDPPYDGQHVIVPTSWIPAYDSEDEMGVVKYPHSPLVGLEQWVEDKEDYCEDWGNFVGFVKYGDDSYGKAKEYIERLTSNTDEEPQIKKKKITPTPTQDKPNIETFIINCNNNVEELISLVSNMTLSEATSQKLLDSLNKYLSDFKEKCDIFDDIRTNFGNICSSIEKIKDYIMVNKIKLNNTSNTAKDDVKDEVANKFKQTEQKEGIQNSKINKKVSIVMNTENSSCTVKENQQKEGILLQNLIDTTSDVTKLKVNQEQQKDFVIDDKSENPLGALELFINTQNEPEEIESQLDNEEEEDGQLHIVIDTGEDNTADIENNPGQSKHLNIKKSLECYNNYLGCDVNKTRWTWKHSERKEGLVELIEGSGVYVDERQLILSTSISSNSISLAQRLILEVFSLDAIDKCEIRLGNKSIEGIRGLDAYALGILMRYVKQYSFDKNYIQSESDIFNAIQKKIMYTKNKIKLKRTKYVHDRKAADNTAQFFLESFC